MPVLPPEKTRLNLRDIPHWAERARYLILGAFRVRMEGADVWISDCLSRRPHPTHAHLDAVLGWAREMNVGQLYLSHLDNSMDYRSLLSELPDWVAPAHDGLEIVLS